MIAAFACWEERIAPVFDVARQALIVDADQGRILHEEHRVLPEEPVAGRVDVLIEWGVDELVCGAISRPLHGMLLMHGISVTPFVAGDLREIINAWMAGALAQDVYAMPGCCGRRRRGHSQGTCQPGMEGFVMRGRNRGGMGGGMGQGKERSQGRGQMGGPLAAGPEGYCVCPKCGVREPHERGVPCASRQCPQCGSPMTRGE